MEDGRSSEDASEELSAVVVEDTALVGLAMDNEDAPEALSPVANDDTACVGLGMV